MSGAARVSSRTAPIPGDQPEAKRRKLSRLPKNAVVSKRPLLRPAIPSPYSGAKSPKCVYVSAHTPFLSAVKRVEKLLRLAEKRNIQSATTLAKRRARHSKTAKDKQDHLLEAAMIVEKEKASKADSEVEATGRTESVLIKGSGKAVQKVLELGLWFQQRAEYVVRLSTGSAGAIDDISVKEQDGQEELNDEGSLVPTEVTDNGLRENLSSKIDRNGENDGVDIVEMPKDKMGPTLKGDVTQEISSTRIRYTSVLEVAVSLR